MTTKRPSALGAEIVVTSLDEANVVLAEMSWLANEQARLDALCKQRVEALKIEYAAKSVVEIDGETVSIAERLAALEAPLDKWVAKHIAKHLPPKKKSVELTHGTLGLRQQPQVVELPAGTKPQSVLDLIDEETGLVTAVNAVLERTLTNVGKHVHGRDLISVEIKPALKSMLNALDAKRLTQVQIEGWGAALREAYDEAVIKPAKVVVSDAA